MMSAYVRAVVLMVLFAQFPCVVFADLPSPTKSPEPPPWFRPQLTNEQIPSAEFLILEKLVTQYGDESAIRQASIKEDSSAESPAVIVAIVAVLFAILVPYMQDKSNKKQELSKLTFEIWSKYLEGYAEHGAVLDLLGSRPTRDDAEFIRVQRFRNWLNSIAALGNKSMLSNEMMATLGMTQVLRGFLADLNLAVDSFKKDASPLDLVAIHWRQKYETELGDCTPMTVWLATLTSIKL